MEKIIASRNRVLSKQRWLYEEKGHRIGNPFEWPDGDWKQEFTGIHGVLRFLSMFYEQYPTPEEIKSDDYDQMGRHIDKTLRDFYQQLVPFQDSTESHFEKNIVATTLVRLQDYSFIRTHCGDLRGPINHLDLGPGLGSHAIYSQEAYQSCFYAVEAVPNTYAAQREFLRFLSRGNPDYLDVVDCEDLDLNEEAIAKEVNAPSKYRVKHIPSWHFEMVQDQTIDLVTGTWMMNELNHAGILWLMANSIRSLKDGGYFYIRDRGELKPLRHTIDYDQLLADFGFVQVARLNVQNRVDYYGVPRVFQKKTSMDVSFESLAERYLGRFAITSIGGASNQGMS